VPFFFANRFMRILPLYGCCLLFWWHLAPRLPASGGGGPFWFAWDGHVDKVVSDK
jgi:peptidoglycan/LPS O-acetylase OafA/YrhL